MIRANFNANPSDLDDVLEQVRDLFAAAGDTTTIQIGRAYLEDFGGGVPPLVLFVPEAEGEVAPAIEAGRVCSVIDGCDVHIRGAEDGSDLGRYRSAWALRRRVMTAIRRAASGRLEFGKYEPTSPLKTDSGLGAEVSFSFRYQHDIRHDAAIMAVKPAQIDATLPRPEVPPGQPAGAVTPLVFTTPQE